MRQAARGTIGQLRSHSKGPTLRANDLTDLRARWLSIDSATVHEVRAQVLAANGVVNSPFGTHDGRVDLRGLVLVDLLTEKVGPYRRGKPRRNKRLGAWTGLDLRGASLQSLRLLQVDVRDCVFDDADLTNLACWGVNVECCSFRRATLYSSQLGAGPDFWPHQSTWSEVSFRQADLRRAIAASQFDHVDFRNARFGTNSFTSSSFLHCAFAGVVAGFELGKRTTSGASFGGRLERVDMTAAKPRRLWLMGVDLGAPHVDLRLPNDSDHWWIADWPAFLDRVEKRAAGVDDRELRIAAEVWVYSARADLDPHQSAGFVATHDLVELGGEGLRELLSACRFPD